MLHKIVGGLVLVVLTSAATAMAADEATLGVSVVAAKRAVEQSGGLRAPLLEVPKARRGNLLPSLYISFAGLNAYDAYATLTGVSRGATEQNVMMRGAVRSPAAVWAIKGGVTAGAILASERLWPSGHRAQAIGMMIASNVVMTVVAAHNQRVLGQQR